MIEFFALIILSLILGLKNSLDTIRNVSKTKMASAQGYTLPVIAVGLLLLTVEIYGKLDVNLPVAVLLALLGIYQLVAPNSRLSSANIAMIIAVLLAGAMTSGLWSLIAFAGASFAGIVYIGTTIKKLSEYKKKLSTVDKLAKWASALACIAVAMLVIIK